MPEKRNRFDRRKAAYAGLLLLGACIAGGCKEPATSGKVTEAPMLTATIAPRPTETEKPTATVMPQPTEITEPTAMVTIKPFYTPTVEPTEAVTPTTMPMIASTATPTVEPTERPTSTPTVEPTVTVTPTIEPTSVITVAPTAEPTPIPSPVPTAYPEYDTLIQSGWQRTEDFFGEHEIFFSGMFDTVELVAVPGLYEYQYTVTTNAEVSFSILGEEGEFVHSVLEALLALYPECLVTVEGEGDYSYKYTAQGQTVSGRVYDCTQGEQANYMRVELVYPAENENYGNEGYAFYIK